MITKGARSTSAAVVTIAVTALLGGCGGEPVASLRPPTVTTTSASEPTTATATATATAGSPSDLPTTTTGTPASPTVTATTASRTPTASRTSATATASTTASTPATPLRWPKALGEPQQGQPVWAVYLAVGGTNADAAVEKAMRDAVSVGYQAVLGDLACDQGGVEGLKLDRFAYWTAATLYFRTQADARTFAASFTQAVAPVRGVVRIKLGCLD